MPNETKATESASDIDPELQLVDGPTLLQRLFPEQCRPTHRWLQTRVQSKAIPSTKIGHLRFYIPAAVRESFCGQRGLQPVAVSLLVFGTAAGLSLAGDHRPHTGTDESSVTESRKGASTNLGNLIQCIALYSVPLILRKAKGPPLLGDSRYLDYTWSYRLGHRRGQAQALTTR